MSIYCAEVLAPAMVKVLLIRQKVDGFYLERYTESGVFLGGTRHDEMDDAMREAYAAYDPISEWRLCPDAEYPQSPGSGPTTPRPRPER
jgi:hypothetical protein